MNELLSFVSTASFQIVKEHKSSGAKRDRTVNLLRARQALSQLSYSPITLLAKVF
jgi:hypothetical protein